MYVCVPICLSVCLSPCLYVNVWHLELFENDEDVLKIKDEESVRSIYDMHKSLAKLPPLLWTPKHMYKPKRQSPLIVIGLHIVWVLPFLPSSQPGLRSQEGSERPAACRTAQPRVVPCSYPVLMIIIKCLKLCEKQRSMNSKKRGIVYIRYND